MTRQKWYAISLIPCPSVAIEDLGLRMGSTGTILHNSGRFPRISEDGIIFAAIGGTNPIKVFEVFFDYGMSADHNLERGDLSTRMRNPILKL